MEKYGINQEEVDRLLKLKVCKTEQEAIEKVASGESTELIKEAEEAKDDE